MKRGLLVIVALALVASFALVPAVVSAGDYDSSLLLENKDADWNVIGGDSIQGTLEFNSVGATFDYRFTATGLAADTYTLIYYADQGGDRFGEWGGNPGVVIGTWSASELAAGVAASPNLNMDLPSSPDANICEHNYCIAPDNYSNCHGAKIWLIPTSALTGGSSLPVQAWPPTDSWLFETDLIWYDDTDVANDWGCASGFEATTEVLEDSISISVGLPSINFGSVYPGDCSVPKYLGIKNTGSVAVDLSASTSSAFYGDCLRLLAGSYQNVATWSVTSLGEDATWNAAPKVCVPYNYSAGTQTGTIVFWAEKAE